MKDQPWNLNQTWPVGRNWCRCTNTPKNVWAPLPKFGAQKKSNFFTTFFVTSSPDTAYLWKRVDKPKCQSTMCPIKVDFLYVTFVTEMAEIRSVILTHPMRIQHCPSLPGFPHKGRWIQVNQILPDVRRLKGLTVHRKNKNLVPPKISPPA